MPTQRRRLILIVVAAALAALIGAQPIAAYKELRTTGTVGAHSLSDTKQLPGAICAYAYSDRGTKSTLRYMMVDSPNVRAVPGQGRQRVGWSFTIERKIVALGGTSPWEHRYTSPVSKRTTDSTHDAEFSPMEVRVPSSRESGEDNHFFYRATVKAFWYRPNGNVMGTAKMRVEWFVSVERHLAERQRWSCSGHIY